MDTIEVETARGKIRGERNHGVNAFKGIPYGGRVSGERRFRRPAEREPWTGVRDVLQLGAPAIQPPGSGKGQADGLAEGRWSSNRS